MSRTFSEAMSALRHERGLSQRKAAAELRALADKIYGIAEDDET